MKEVWRNIPSLGKDYEASNFGRIKTTRMPKRTKNKDGILSPTRGSSGYLGLNLSHLKLNKRMFLVHRLIGEAFGLLKSLEDPLTIHHKNNDKTDNRLINLKAITHRENLDLAVNDGRYLKGSSVKASKLTEEDIIEIRELLSMRLSDSRISRMFDVNPEAIRKIRIGETWKHVK